MPAKHSYFRSWEQPVSCLLFSNEQFEQKLAFGPAEEAFHVFADNLDKLRALLFRAVPKIGPQPECVCASALGSAIVH